MSAMVSEPLVERFGLAASSTTVAVFTPPMTGTSLVPARVTVTTLLAEPSMERAVKESVIDWPAPSCWMAVWLLVAP